MFLKYRTDNGTRGHSWALAKERCKLDIRKYAFSQRTINEWNRLPGECVNATVLGSSEKSAVARNFVILVHKHQNCYL